MKTKTSIILILSILISFSCASDKNFKNGSGSYKDDTIFYEPKKLTENEKQNLRRSLNHERYDPEEKMITRQIRGYNYHTDATSGLFHDTRASFRPS
jgi:hypothetical protein